MKPSEILARDAQRALFAREPAGRYEVVLAQANGASNARIQIYGAIGDWWDGLDAATLAAQINDLDVDQIEVHLNSPGGIAFDGIAIYNALRQHQATVKISVDGLAASAASIIAMAGDEVVMSLGAQMMIHNASGLCFGKAQDMRQVADILDKISGSLADIYANHAGGTADSWRPVMDAETWYTADEAVAAGLAHRVDRTAAQDNATAAFDLSIFAHAGRDKAPAPRAAHIPPVDPAEDSTPTTEGTANMPDILTSGLRERLGISADANLDDAGYLAAIDEALAERAESTTTTAPGTVQIDEGALAELQASAALGRVAHERQVATDREVAITNAIATGRIPAARADAWRTQLTADPGSLEVLNGLPANTIPMAAIGYAGGVEESTDDDVRDSDTYKNWSN